MTHDGNQGYSVGAAESQRIIAGGACGKGIRYKTGGVALGNGRNNTEHGDAEAFVKAL